MPKRQRLRMFLAIDAGGTSTRAALVDSAGRCLGYGRAGGGNPTSAGIANAVAAVGQAAEQAAGRHRSARSSDRPWRSSRWPGRRPRRSGADRGPPGRTGRRTGASWNPICWGSSIPGPTNATGTPWSPAPGTAAVRVVGGRLDRVAGGRGWLLGDAGGGFWIGHQVVRAVVAALDGQGPPTALTERLLASLGITEPPDSPAGRTQVLRQLVSTLYAWRPVQLSRFAPLAFQVPEDPVAREILVAASSALAESARGRTRSRTWPARSSWAAAC